MSNRKLEWRDWNDYRQHMLDETARFIEWGLAHPESVIEIPSKPVGQGGFPKAVGDWFWGVVLKTRGDHRVQHWRRMLSVGWKRR